VAPLSQGPYPDALHSNCGFFLFERYALWDTANVTMVLPSRQTDRQTDTFI